MWKYIEGKDPSGRPIDEKSAREHFGVVNEACPCVELENGCFAVWFASFPLGTDPAGHQIPYPMLSSKPVHEEDRAKFASV